MKLGDNMVPIYLKTVYSFLSSLITIDELIAFAKKNYYQTLCICDDNMYGAMEFITKCQSNLIKPIVGLDIGKCLLYSKDYIGYQNLMKLATIKTERELDNDDLRKYSDSLISFIPLNSEEKEVLEDIYQDNYLYSEEKNDDSLYLHKTLCLQKKDTEILKYLNMLRDNKRVSDEYLFKDDCYFVNVSDDRYQEFFLKCNLVLPKYELNLPSFCEYNDTKGLNSDEYLANLSILGLHKRMNGNVTLEYKNRLLYELDIIKKMGFSNYFLVVYDYIKYAKSHNILVGPGRGSAASSLVSYSIGITEVDPIKYNLLFERFLNIERVTMPDIDTDFPDEKREEVISYVTNKYGKKKVSLITTFNTFGGKMALRDMGRIMNVPSYIIDNLCKKISNKSLLDSLKDESILKLVESDNKIKKLYSVAARIEGLPRHSSIHAAGVVMANTNLDNLIPLVYDNSNYISAYEAKYLENIGLLKMDFLGIRNLTIIENILKLINKYQNENLKFSDIPLEDDLTNQLFCRGDTLGIFQFEGSGMQEFLRKLQPVNFEDIYNANAFFRPGPSMNIDKYIERRHGLKKIDYYDNRLKNILENTCGIIVYQEQIMQIASVMANFSLGEADVLRRAMSKKKKEEIEKFKEKFVFNSIQNGYSKDMVLTIFDLILNFASYGFNKSHSVAYSMISYKMAYLKAHYAIYFYLSLLSSNISDDEKTISYIKEMKKYGIKISKPDINNSTNDFIIYYDKVLLPLNIIKGISSEVAKKIMEVREDGYQDIYDFFIKITQINLAHNIIELLINSGCLDNFGYNRNTLFQNIDILINYGNLVHELNRESVLKPEIQIYSEYDKDVLINNEKNCFGYYLTNHPVSFYKDKIPSINLIDIKNYFNKNITCVLLVDKIREIVTKTGAKMAFLNCSDEESSVDVVVFPKLYESLSNLEKNDIIKVEGKVERRSAFSLIAFSIVKVQDIV